MIAMALALVLVIACVIVPAVFAAGTGDDPTPTRDVLTRREAAIKEKLERETERLLGRSRGDPGDGGLGTLALDAPYRYLWTPSHRQERPYWCGPATCQVIDHYFGSYTSQDSYGRFMGTTPDGTEFAQVDDCLRAYTGRPYYYYGSLTESSFNYRVADSLMNHGMPLAADLKIIASIWPNYVRDHAGHIVPIEAFDWRFWTVRLNDPYDEARVGGGPTFGHTTYDRAVVWNGVYNHFRRAVVSAP